MVAKLMPAPGTELGTRNRARPEAVALACAGYSDDDQLRPAAACDFWGLKPSWYRLDPIHIRPSLWRAVWQEIHRLCLSE
jgi:hypothetical protein